MSQYAPCSHFDDDGELFALRSDGLTCRRCGVLIPFCLIAAALEMRDTIAELVRWCDGAMWPKSYAAEALQVVKRARTLLAKVKGSVNSPDYSKPEPRSGRVSDQSD